VTNRDKVNLLFGPYQAPSLRRGDRALCRVRDCEVVITGWSDAPMSWPRGYAPSERPGGGLALLVDDQLARAVRRESAAAVCYWWGVGHTTIARWRRALGATRRNNAGSQRLIRSAAATAREAALERGITEAERQRRKSQAVEMGLWRLSPAVTSGQPWTPKEVALLGTLPDPEVARRTGHPLHSVRMKRRALGVGRCAPVRR
jgi:hypothetical protein